MALQADVLKVCRAPNVVPPAFVALARKKYVVLQERPAAVAAIDCVVEPERVWALIVLPSDDESPYSNAVTVDEPFGLTVALKVAAICPIAVAPPMVTAGVLTLLPRS